MVQISYNIISLHKKKKKTHNLNYNKAQIIYSIIEEELTVHSATVKFLPFDFALFKPLP